MKAKTFQLKCKVRDLKGTLKMVERELIIRALAQSGGSRTEAAKLLDINRTTLQMKLNKHEDINE